MPLPSWRDRFFHRANAVNRITGIEASACFVSRNTSRPEAPGIFKSVMDQQIAGAREPFGLRRFRPAFVQRHSRRAPRFAKHGAQFVFIFDQKSVFHLLRFLHDLSGQSEQRDKGCAEKVKGSGTPGRYERQRASDGQGK